MDKIVYTIMLLAMSFPLFSLCVSANCEDHTISLIDTETWTISRSIHVGKNPRELAWHPGSKKLFVSNSGSNTVSCVNLSDHTLQTISTGSEPRGLSLSKDGKFLYIVLKCEDAILVLDTDNHQKIIKHAVGKGPRNTSVADDLICCSNNEDDSITIYENEISYTHKFAPGTRPYGLCVADNMLYITSIGENAVIIFDLSKKSEVARVQVGRHPTALVRHPTKPLLYSTSLDDDSISVIDLDMLSMQATIPVGHNPFGLCLSPDKKYLAVTNNGDHSITIVDIATHRVEKVLSVGNDPHGILWLQ